MKKNEKYSHCSRESLLDVDPAELDGTVIMGSCFCSQTPYFNVLPKLPDGGRCQLQDCNVDNVSLPEGYECVRSTTNKHFITQKDGEYWLVDEKLNPVEPRDIDRYNTLGLSTNPVNLPKEQLEEPITMAMNPAILKQRTLAMLVSEDFPELAAVVASKISDMKRKSVVGEVTVRSVEVK